MLLGDPPALEAIQFRADLIHKHRVAPTPDELKAQGGRAALFQGGNLLLYHNPVGDVASNRRSATFDWSLSGVAHGQGKPATSSGGGVGWFLANDSKVKDETWELMKVLASKESVKLEAVRGEAPPSRRSVASDPEFVSLPDPPKGDMKVVVEALELIHTETPLLQGVDIDAVLDDELGKVWSGAQTARDGVAKAVDRIKPLLNQPS